MTDNEDTNEYTPYAAGIPVEEPLYEFTSATFTTGEDGSAVVEVPAVEDVEPVADVPAVEEEKPKAKAKPVVSSEPTHVIGSGDADEVRLDACVYKNTYARKSLTIHHLQRRLDELGYGDANNDRDGWYGDLTVLSVSQFQKDNNLEATGMMDADTLSKIFAGDPNVRVVLPE